MNKFYVYRHIRLDTNLPFYIGKGCGKRAWVTDNRKNQYWKRIVEKHGYKVEIMLSDLSESLAFDKEMELIKFYKSLGFKLTNMTDGGEGSSGLIAWNKGISPTQETIEKTAITRGCKPFQCFKDGVFVWEGLLQTKCIEFLGLNSSSKGNINQCLSNKRVSHKGYKFKYLHEDEFREPMPNQHTVESRRKISESNKGKASSKESKEKNKLAHTKHIQAECFKDGILVKAFTSVDEIIEFLGLKRSDRSNIWQCLKGNSSTCKGHTFQYIL